MAGGGPGVDVIGFFTFFAIPFIAFSRVTTRETVEWTNAMTNSAGQEMRFIYLPSPAFNCGMPAKPPIRESAAESCWAAATAQV